MNAESLNARQWHLADSRAHAHRPQLRRFTDDFSQFIAEREREGMARSESFAPRNDPIGSQLEMLVSSSDVVVLHHLLGPESAPTIDHVCVGPGGVTVIDSKSYEARVRGRRGELWVGKRTNTGIVAGVLEQLELVRATLGNRGFEDVDVRGAICSRRRGGLRIRSASVDGIRVDDLKALARLSRRDPIGGPSIDVGRAVSLLRGVLRSPFDLQSADVA